MFYLISFFLISAIFNDELIVKFIVNLKLNSNVEVIKKSLNHRKLFFNVQFIHFVFVINYENLWFLVSNIEKSLLKIIVYENFMFDFLKINKILIVFHVKIETSRNQIITTIQCYNDKMFDLKKKVMYENLSRLNFKIKILCVINVLNLGMNIVDVNLMI